MFVLQLVTSSTSRLVPLVVRHFQCALFSSQHFHGNDDDDDVSIAWLKSTGVDLNRKYTVFRKKTFFS